MLQIFTQKSIFLDWPHFQSDSILNIVLSSGRNRHYSLFLRHGCMSIVTADRCVLSLCDWLLLLQGLEHWEEVFAALEGETLSLFKDREAAAEVRKSNIIDF